jgi:hypothetical protein|tara:strand:+ start:649 stop:861 length:213 start_codon:yes stop_codon:yes gene_type:complete
MSNQNPENPTDPIWQTHMQTLTKRKMLIEISATIHKAITEYYEEQGKPVPQWRQKRDPDWWTEYKDELSS